ncbi:MAG TPA: SMC-Scp complex subunit ScpB [Acidobacteriaceae bacterium]|nr:SMC-Scp complex subunit ScpB [Acidobacteriaceae bacterium]
MSLKAKMEAVIYASEEPVTLTQLIGLLGEEAEAELDQIAAAQQPLALQEAAPAGPGEESGATRLDSETWDGPDNCATQASDPEEPTAGSESESGDAAATAATKAEKARAARLRAFFRAELDSLIAGYTSANADRGIEIREIAGGFRFATKPEYHDAVRGFVKSLKPPLKLTLPALETLAVIAYKQPVTAPEISEIRGVDSGGVLATLIARKLITTAGRKQVIGRPMLYKTGKEFLLKFGLKDLNELPSIEEFEKLAGQFAEQEEIPMGAEHHAPETPEQLESERGTHEPQPDGINSEEAAAGNVSEETGDRASIDGRISSLPPNYAAEEEAENPSAQEAAIQQNEGVE